MRNSLILLLSVCLLISCGPKWHLKQARKHELKAIAKGATIQTDTVWVDRHVYVKEIVQDTLLVTTDGDTVFIERDRLKIKFVDLPGDSVFIEGKCEADTIIQKVPITITKVIQAPDKALKWWQLMLIGAWAMLVLFFIIRK